jgi:hypothetical protein
LLFALMLQLLGGRWGSAEARAARAGIVALVLAAGTALSRSLPTRSTSPLPGALCLAALRPTRTAAIYIIALRIWA